MKNIINKKICLFALIISFIICTLTGFALISTYANVSITDFYVPGGQVKFAVDSNYNGVRFPTLMNEIEYNANKDYITTGILLCDAENLDEDGQLTHSTAGVVDVETTELWRKSKVAGYMEAAAFIYKIPHVAEAYLNKIAAVGYYKIGDGKPAYTNTIVRSAAQIADMAYKDRKATQDEDYKYYVEEDGNYSRFDIEQREGVLSYLPNLTVTYKVDGSEDETQTVRYGQKAEFLELKDIIGYEFSSWQLNGVDYDFDNEEGVTSDITLTANYKEKDYVYGKGFDLIVAQNASNCYEAKITEGDNIGKWYKRYEKGADAGYAISLNLKASKEAGLKPLTTYGVVLNILTDATNNTVAMYDLPSGADVSKWSLGGAEMPYAGFTVTTDANGEFNWEDEAYVNTNVTYFDFIGLQVAEVAYKEGITVDNTSYGTSVMLSGVIASEGETAGKYVATWNRFANVGPKLQISGSTALGLKPNTQYGVKIDVKTDATGNGLYATDNSWFVSSVTKSIVEDVVTDENGKFAINRQCYFSSGTYLIIENITVMEYVYGNGVSIVDNSVNAANRAYFGGDKITEGENEGKYVKTLNFLSSGGGALTLKVSSARGLAPNKTYQVTLDMDAPGATSWLYNEPNNAWLVGNGGDKTRPCTFTVTTDSNGEFTKTWSTYRQKSSGVIIFSGLTIKGSAYNEGVSLTLAPEKGLSVSDVNIGNELYAKKLQRDSASAFCTVKVDATAQAGLEANTTYSINVDVTTNGVKNTFYKESIFFIHGSSTVTLGTATTDANGVLTFTINQCYLGKGSNPNVDTEPTFVLFNNITFIKVQ